MTASNEVHGCVGDWLQPGRSCYIRCCGWSSVRHCTGPCVLFSFVW